MHIRLLITQFLFRALFTIPCTTVPQQQNVVKRVQEQIQICVSEKPRFGIDNEYLLPLPLPLSVSVRVSVAVSISKYLSTYSYACLSYLSHTHTHTLALSICAVDVLVRFIYICLTSFFLPFCLIPI